jgi:hypothetical protein
MSSALAPLNPLGTPMEKGSPVGSAALQDPANGNTRGFFPAVWKRKVQKSRTRNTTHQ